MPQTIVITAISLSLSTVESVSGFIGKPRAFLPLRSRLHRKPTFTLVDSCHDGTEHNNCNYELHLLTFDLDDTIFPIDPVIHDANSVMIQTLHSLGFHGACNNEIISASKQIRHELRMSGNEITYTELRKRSIQREIERLAIADRSDVAFPPDDSVIHTVFESWLSERHTSANRNLFPFAVSSLKCVERRIQPWSSEQ